MGKKKLKARIPRPKEVRAPKPKPSAGTNPTAQDVKVPPMGRSKAYYDIKRKAR